MAHPPVIEERILPSTPAEEWATSTASSLGTSDATPNTTSTAASSEPMTPGPAFPGAFPQEAAAESTNGGVLGAAKGYIPSQNDVKSAVMHATGTAKQYLPDALTSYFRKSYLLLHRALLKSNSVSGRWD